MTTPHTSTATPWFAVSMGLVGLIVGYALASGIHGFSLGAQPSQVAQAPSAPSKDNPAPTPPAPTGTAPKTGIGPVLGKANAKVTVVEFTDFQCPFCGRHYTQTFGQIKKDYVDTGKIKYELRNFPLSSIHPNAEIGSEAAMCANKQNKFWEMHDKLFTNQGSWSAESDPSATLKKYAADIGLNAADFAKCLSNHDTKAQVAKDTTAGSSAGIDGTPGFWIIGPNGQTKQIKGAYPFATFQSAIDTMLKG